MQPVKRRISKSLSVGGVRIGGGAPLVIQSMNACSPTDVEGNLEQLRRLAEAGCRLSRLAVPDRSTLSAFQKIAARSPLPLVADIHFDYRLALAAIDAGAAALRLNPGNIREPGALEKVAAKARAQGVPIRVGVNAGSLDPHMLSRAGGNKVESMVASALQAVEQLEQVGFTDICISLKASDPGLTIAANRRLAEVCDYPLHLGLTEAGPPPQGAIKSAVALAPLLYLGIGDTIRVSLTADPVEEVKAARLILQSLNLLTVGARLIACPGCGRTEVDMRPLAEQVQAYLEDIQEPLTVAVMGCAVNGPGEAREADLGLAGGRHEYLLFARGKVLAKVPEAEAWPALKAAIDEELLRRKA